MKFLHWRPPPRRELVCLRVRRWSGPLPNVYAALSTSTLLTALLVNLTTECREPFNALPLFLVKVRAFFPRLTPTRPVLVMASAVDIPLQVVSDNARAERRISPAWSIAQLKSRLEPVTGVPASAQRLSFKLSGSGAIRSLDAEADTTQLSNLNLQSAAEIHVGHLGVSCTYFARIHHALVPQSRPHDTSGGKRNFSTDDALSSRCGTIAQPRSEKTTRMSRRYRSTRCQRMSTSPEPTACSLGRGRRS